MECGRTSQIWSARNTCWRLWYLSALELAVRCCRGLRVYDAVKIEMRPLGYLWQHQPKPHSSINCGGCRGRPCCIYCMSSRLIVELTLQPYPSLLLSRAIFTFPLPDLATSLCFCVCNFLTAPQRNSNWHHEDQIVLGMQTRQIQRAKNTCWRLWYLWQHQGPCIHHLI